MEIKQIQWEEEGYILHGDTGIGMYDLIPIPVGESKTFYVDHEYFGHIGEAKDMESAKQLAQDDLKARITSCLEFYL